MFRKDKSGGLHSLHSLLVTMTAFVRKIQTLRLHYQILNFGEVVI